MDFLNDICFMQKLLSQAASSFLRRLLLLNVTLIRYLRIQPQGGPFPTERKLEESEKKRSTDFYKSQQSSPPYL